MKMAYISAFLLLLLPLCSESKGQAGDILEHFLTRFTENVDRVMDYSVDDYTEAIDYPSADYNLEDVVEYSRDDYDYPGGSHQGDYDYAAVDEEYTGALTTDDAYENLYDVDQDYSYEDTTDTIDLASPVGDISEEYTEDENGTFSRVVNIIRYNSLNFYAVITEYKKSRNENFKLCVE